MIGMSSSSSEGEKPKIWFEREDPITYYTTTLSEKHPELLEKVKLSVEVILKTLDEYTTPIALGFNGGKDSIVIVNLVLIALISRQSTAANSTHLIQTLNKHCLFFHFTIPHQFPEMDTFLEESSKQYEVDLKLIDATLGFKRGLEVLIETSPTKLDAVFMGTRKIDPDGQFIGVFEKTSAGWPEMMRVSPILDWDYQDVWNFILDLSIPYCSLYDLGYTSLGSVNDTLRNEALRQPDDAFLPAFYLMDGSLERAGRIKKPKKEN